MSKRVYLIIAIILVTFPILSENKVGNENINKKQEELELKKNKIKSLSDDINELKKQEKAILKDKRLTSAQKKKKARKLKQLIKDKTYIKNNLVWWAGQEESVQTNIVKNKKKSNRTKNDLSGLIDSYEDEFIDLFFLNVPASSNDIRREQILIKSLMAYQEDVIFDLNTGYLKTVNSLEANEDKLSDIKDKINNKQKKQENIEKKYTSQKQETDELNVKINKLSEKQLKVTGEKEILIAEKNKLEKEASELENFIAQLLSGQSEIDKSKIVNNILIKRPCQGTIVKDFGEKLNALSKVTNKGINYKLTPGSSISAVYSGKVIYSGYVKSKGQVLIIDHENGFVSVYAYNNKLNVKIKDLVKQGDVIGSSGTNSSGKPMSYFELRKRNKPVNPNMYFKN